MTGVHLQSTNNVDLMASKARALNPTVGKVSPTAHNGSEDTRARIRHFFLKPGTASPVCV